MPSLHGFHIIVTHKSCLKNLDNYYQLFPGEYFDLQKPA